MPICTICNSAALDPPRRKYCGVRCAAEASRRWKRDLRRSAREDFAAGRTTEPYWKEGWPSEEARKAYFRNYMRRRRHRSAAPLLEAPAFDTTSVGQPDPLGSSGCRTSVITIVS